MYVCMGIANFPSHISPKNEKKKNTFSHLNDCVGCLFKNKNKEKITKKKLYFLHN